MQKKQPWPSAKEEAMTDRSKTKTWLADFFTTAAMVLMWTGFTFMALTFLATVAKLAAMWARWAWNWGL